MGGIDSVRYWMRTVEHGLIREHERRGIPAWRPEHYDGPPIRADALYGYRVLRPQWFGVDLARDEKAESRAAELFKISAGAEAFRVLDSGGALPIKGSKGTKYTLHKRAAYCVERVKDGAKLCAVVPGVPLWDHLLGVKLMVEHDEPRFLRTANVIGGRDRRFWSWA